MPNVSIRARLIFLSALLLAILAVSCAVLIRELARDSRSLAEEAMLVAVVRDETDNLAAASSIARCRSRLLRSPRRRKALRSVKGRANVSVGEDLTVKSLFTKNSLRDSRESGHDVTTLIWSKSTAHRR